MRQQGNEDAAVAAGWQQQTLDEILARVRRTAGRQRLRVPGRRLGAPPDPARGRVVRRRGDPRGARRRAHPALRPRPRRRHRGGDRVAASRCSSPPSTRGPGAGPAAAARGAAHAGRGRPRVGVVRELVVHLVPGAHDRRPDARGPRDLAPPSAAAAHGRGPARGRDLRRPRRARPRARPPGARAGAARRGGARGRPTARARGGLPGHGRAGAAPDRRPDGLPRPPRARDPGPAHRRGRSGSRARCSARGSASARG